MQINPISNGIVLDHITAGKIMELYYFLHLDELNCSVAIIKNADSKRMGKKDILKIDADINLDLDVVGYIDPDITVNIIQNGEVIKTTKLELPERLVDVIKCKNPRCITSTEQELPHIFTLFDRKNKVYRCVYCESKAAETR